MKKHDTTASQRLLVTKNANIILCSGDAGFLGPAKTEIVGDGNSTHGFHIDYQNGHIYWSPGSGAHTIVGPIYDKWIAQGGPQSNFGFPLTDDASTADNQAHFNNFGIGAIYFNSGTGAHLVYGNIYLKWVAVGGEAGFGFPVADEAPAGHGRVSEFSRGSIYWSGPTQAHTVFGDIRNR